MRKLIVFLSVFHFTQICWAVDGFYLGGQLGHIGLSGDVSRTYSNSIGFGADLGVKVNSNLDLMLNTHWSSHSGRGNGNKIFATYLSAEAHLMDVNDVLLSVAAGPGLYFFNTDTGKESNFGLHIGGIVDVMADENLKVGVGILYHGVFSGNSVTSGKLWTALVRLSYFFESNP